MSSVSSSWAPPPSWSWALVVCNCLSELSWSGCRCGGGGSWYWLFESAAVKSLSMKSHFEPSCAVVSQVVSFVTSLSSLRDLVDCGCKRCRISWLVFLASDTLSAWLKSLAYSWRSVLSQRPSWCLATSAPDKEKDCQWHLNGSLGAALHTGQTGHLRPCSLACCLLD